MITRRHNNLGVLAERKNTERRSSVSSASSCLLSPLIIIRN